MTCTLHEEDRPRTSTCTSIVIAVNDALVMGGIQRRGDLPDHMDAPSIGMRPTRRRRWSRSSPSRYSMTRYGSPDSAWPKSEDGHEVWVPEMRRDPGLAMEARQGLAVGGQVSRHQLDRDSLVSNTYLNGATIT